MGVKKIPMRTCVVTREKFPKQELLRIVKFGDTVNVDITGKQNGKGCYIKKSKEVVEKARKSKAIDRALDIQIDTSIYDEILKYID